MKVVAIPAMVHFDLCVNCSLSLPRIPNWKQMEIHFIQHFQREKSLVLLKRGMRVPLVIPQIQMTDVCRQILRISMIT